MTTVNKVLVADDHPLVRDALVRTVAAVLPQAEIRQAGDWNDVLAALAALAPVTPLTPLTPPSGPATSSSQPPALMLVDLHMPGLNGLDGVRQLRREHPELIVVVASGDDEPATIRAALALGVRGFLPKSEPAEVIAQALTLVCAGGTYIPAGAMVGLATGLATGSAPAPLPSPAGASAGLTPRQLDVLRCLAQGLPNKLIARELALTEGTVKIHIAAILRVLGARNRTEALVRARAAGLAL